MKFSTSFEYFTLGPGQPCANAFSALLISGRSKFETGLLNSFMQFFTIFSFQTPTPQEIPVPFVQGSMDIIWNCRSE